ncbi:hypothetical protein FHS43_001886 [Streptosporangium becharense]|uniref:Nucleotidyltransferase family protein n=1 Tax=Streptosporangium becharense TaxID=1816182 RepID=A0A7W9MEG7_9ACTN|nr:nucleotidyltransferase family protein [Streptosporangium becharense]MBB2910623.1 hypothetical protein [Streptosporangium becharense]MBB5817319.1 hypothetical protein [Streptosporangium becharense]
MERDEIPETWRLLERVSIASPGNEAFDEAQAMISRGVDGDLLVGFAARHALAPALADHLTRSGTLGRLHNRVQRHLKDSLTINRLRIGEHLREAARISDRVAAAGLRVAFTKGVAAQARLYDGTGARVLGDLDVMVSPEDAPKLAQVVEELGYAGGKVVDPASRELVDMPRPAKLLFKLRPDHLPHFFRPSGNPYFRYHIVDVAFSFTWFGCRWAVGVPEALANASSLAVDHEGGRSRIPVLDPVHDFVFHVLHLFREAWWVDDTNPLADVRLSQFADVWRAWDRLSAGERADAVALIRDRDLGPPVAWVCFHLDELFGSAVVEEIGLRGFCSPRWLRSAADRNVGGAFLSWDGDMRLRLRSRTGVEVSPAERPPFV